MSELRKGYVEPIDAATVLALNYSDAAVVSDVAALVSYAERLVDTFCNCSYTDEQDAAKIFSGRGTPSLGLRGAMLRAVTLIELLDVDAATVVQTLDASSYRPQPSNPVRHDGAGNGLFTWIQLRNAPQSLVPTSVFPEGLDNVKVTGDWGMEKVASEIRLGVIYTVRHLMQERDHDAHVLTETGLGRTVQYIDPGEVSHIPKIAQSLLAKWQYRGEV